MYILPPPRGDRYRDRFQCTKLTTLGFPDQDNAIVQRRIYTHIVSSADIMQHAMACYLYPQAGNIPDDTTVILVKFPAAPSVSRQQPRYKGHSNTTPHLKIMYLFTESFTGVVGVVELNSINTCTMVECNQQYITFFQDNLLDLEAMAAIEEELKGMQQNYVYVYLQVHWLNLSTALSVTVMIDKADSIRAVDNDFSISQRLVQKLPEKYRVQLIIIIVRYLLNFRQCPIVIIVAISVECWHAPLSFSLSLRAELTSSPRLLLD